MTALPWHWWMSNTVHAFGWGSCLLQLFTAAKLCRILHREAYRFITYLPHVTGLFALLHKKSTICCYQVGSLQMNPYMLRWAVNSRQLVWIPTHARWKTHLDSSNTLIVKDRNGCSFSFWKNFGFGFSVKFFLCSETTLAVGSRKCTHEIESREQKLAPSLLFRAWIWSQCLCDCYANTSYLLQGGLVSGSWDNLSHLPLWAWKVQHHKSWWRHKYVGRFSESKAIVEWFTTTKTATADRSQNLL